MSAKDETPTKSSVEREIDEGVVKLNDTERGMGMEFELIYDPDLGKEAVELAVTTTPEFMGERKTYQEECRLTYALSGSLIRVSTNIFMGSDIDEGLVRSARGLTPFMMAALSYAGQNNKLVSEVAGDEAAATSFTTFVNIPVMTGDGFTNQRLEREVKVPDRLDIGYVEGLFDPNSTAYQDAFDRIPVDIIKPV